ncbi:MAG: hypothetical protein NTY29_07785 [Proteobacteria bacterium]|nr:hypothetical protein [Pseudomonadota bacterium]
MEKKIIKSEDLKLMRLSLFLKSIIISWSFYLSVQAESWPESIFYLCVSILFVGLLIFQGSKYNSLRKEPIEESED